MLVKLKRVKSEEQRSKTQDTGQEKRAFSLKSGVLNLESPKSYSLRSMLSAGGFTLIELMVVIAILALLGGVVMPRVIGRLRQAKPDKAKIDVRNIGLALDMYAADNGQYPSSEQGLQALLREPTAPPEPMNWRGPYADPTKFLDPWGNQYIYVSPSTHEGYDYDLYSYGADGQEGGTDEDADINSWLEEDEY